MARKKNKGRGNAGRGRGRGGAIVEDRQPHGSPGVIRQKNEKQKRGGRGGGRGGHESARQSCRSAKKSGPRKGNPLERVVDEVREEGLCKLQEIKHAHNDAVMAICITEDSIYTASRDKSLKRWKPQRNATGRFELVPDLEVPIGDQCLCMVHVGEWLFCGLGCGNIKGFSKVGKETVLNGHSKRCSALLVHLHVLLSAGSDGTVKCWQMDQNTQAFGCTHTIVDGLPGTISAMEVLGDHLWVGGSSGVSVVELSSLRVVHQLQPKKFVASFLVFQGHMIVTYADGASAIYDGVGNQKMTQPPMPAGPILCLGGLQVGPRMLCGHAKGQVTSVALPRFQVTTHWQAFERCKVQSLACAPGLDGLFIVGAENGSLQLWQKDPSTSDPPTM